MSVVGSPPSRPVAATAVCTAAIGVGAALGFVPGYVSVALQDSLALTKAQVGLLVSLYFGATGVASIAGGRLAGRYGPRAVVSADMVVVGACAGAGAVTGSYLVLLLTAVVAGAGYAWANAGTNDALARLVPPANWSLALSVKTAGVPAMAAVTAAFGPAVAARWSWQVVWTAVAVVAVVVAVVAWLVLGSDRSSAPPVTTTDPTGRSNESAVHPDSARRFWWFAAASFLFVGGSQPIFSWIVPYLQDRLGASAAVAGTVASVAAGLGVVAMITNGRMADRIGAEGRIDRLLALVAASTLAMATIMIGPAFGATAGLVVVAAAIVVATSVQLSTIGTMHAAVVDRAGSDVAPATGVTMTGYYLGALVSPVGFGLLIDLTGRYWPSWLVMVALLSLSFPAWRRAGRLPLRPR